MRRGVKKYKTYEWVCDECGASAVQAGMAVPPGWTMDRHIYTHESYHEMHRVCEVVHLCPKCRKDSKEGE